jgi:hypothetical protein
MAGDDASADVDPDEFPAESARTVACDPVPEAIDSDTARVEHTGRHRLTPAQFATGVELADRDGYQRGFAAGRAEAEADAITELRKVREDCIETVRALFVIFEIRYPDWPAAEEWIRRRLTPL